MWLVDGNNVMGSRPDGWWRDRPKAMQRLVDEVERFAERTDATAEIVFDGRDRGLRAERVAVAYAPHADDAIAERAGPGTTVVTSDRELAARVRAKGAAVEGARAFLDRM